MSYKEEVIEAQAHQQEDRDRKRGSALHSIFPDSLKAKAEASVLLTALVTLTCPHGTPGHTPQPGAFLLEARRPRMQLPCRCL